MFCGAAAVAVVVVVVVVVGCQVEGGIGGVGEVAVEAEEVVVVVVVLGYGALILEHCTDEGSFHGVEEVDVLLLRPIRRRFGRPHLRRRVHCGGGGGGD